MYVCISVTGIKIFFSCIMSWFYNWFRWGPQPQETTESQDLKETPWRVYKKVDQAKFWTKEHGDEILDFISDITTRHKPVNILLLGQVASGKSSLINSYFSILNDEISSRAKVGSKDSSYTTQECNFPGHGKLENVTFFDIMGLEVATSQGLAVDDAVSAIRGRLKLRTTLNSKESANVQEINKGAEIHCVMFVVDAENVYAELADKLQSKLDALDEKMRVDANRVVVVTHIDQLCETVKKDIKTTFRSNKIEEAVRKAARLIGVPINYVFPVKNYTAEEMEIYSETNILLLLALKQAIQFGIDYQIVKDQKDDLNTD